jgi:hypothetical protein
VSVYLSGKQWRLEELEIDGASHILLALKLFTDGEVVFLH